MFCPQCGNEAPDGQQFCRRCGANLGLIAKGVKVAETIGRSDRGPLPKIREFVNQIKVATNMDEIDRAVDDMDEQIVEFDEEMERTTAEIKEQSRGWRLWEQPTREQRRAKLIESGMSSLFGGIGWMVVLFIVAEPLVRALPPDLVARIPFDLEPWIPIIWILGLIPALTGLGKLAAAVAIRPSNQSLHQLPITPPQTANQLNAPPLSASVTEHTTELLDDREAPVHTRERDGLQS